MILGTEPGEVTGMKHLLTFGCLAAAGVCYAMSFETGAGVLFAAGALLELTFWGRIGLGRSRRRAVG
jgi:hypothetical protein